jgi:hypothetical protein
MNARAAFRQRDLDRIFKAAKRAGVGARLKPDGTVEVLTESVAEAQRRNPWDEVFDETPSS